MAKANRTLENVTYIRGVPMFGRCSQCGRPFITPPDATANAQKAIEDFHQAFLGHNCREDPSQAAARIVREATEQK